MHKFKILALFLVCGLMSCANISHLNINKKGGIYVFCSNGTCKGGAYLKLNNTTVRADSMGGFYFADLKPSKRYKIQSISENMLQVSQRIEVKADSTSIVRFDIFENPNEAITPSFIHYLEKPEYCKVKIAFKLPQWMHEYVAYRPFTNLAFGSYGINPFIAANLEDIQDKEIVLLKGKYSINSRIDFHDAQETSILYMLSNYAKVDVCNDVITFEKWCKQGDIELVYPPKPLLQHCF